MRQTRPKPARKPRKPKIAASVTEPATEAPRRVGRPSIYSPEVASEIWRRLIEGESMRSISRDPAMPSRFTMLEWLRAKPEFQTECARARTLQADLMDDMIRDIIETVTPESAPADRVKLAALQWRASKLEPKKYGDRVTAEVTGADGGPVMVDRPLCPAEVAAAIGAMLAENEVLVGLPPRPPEMRDPERLKRVLDTGEPITPGLYAATVTGPGYPLTRGKLQ